MIVIRDKDTNKMTSTRDGRWRERELIITKLRIEIASAMISKRGEIYCENMIDVCLAGDDSCYSCDFQEAGSLFKKQRKVFEVAQNFKFLG